MRGRQFPKVETMPREAAPDITASTDFPMAHWKRIWSTNPLERLDTEINRRTDVVGAFPNPAALLRLAGSVPVEAHDERQVADRRYLSEPSLALLEVSEHSSGTIAPAAALTAQWPSQSPTRTRRRFYTTPRDVDNYSGAIGSPQSRGSRDTPAPRRVGRPPLKTLRASQIVDAFIELVAVHGLEHVSLDDVADRAEVKRAALRHFVGNREDLIDAAITEITRRATTDLGGTPTVTGLINMLFSQRRIAEKSVEADAWTALLGEALRSDSARAVVKGNYERLLTVIADALRHNHPQATEAEIRGTAYAIACLAEQNWNFQLAGLPRARGADAKAAALTLAAQLP